jgi:hypothetical protein
MDLNMPFDDEWGNDHAYFDDGNVMLECEARPERADTQTDSVLPRLGNEKGS